MKICIISFGHNASSLPLAKYLAKDDLIDVYFIGMNGVVKNIEGTDCYFTGAKNKVGTIPVISAPMLYKYIEDVSSNLHLRYINTFSECKSIKILRDIMSYVRLIQIKRICNVLNNMDYDVCYLVGRYRDTEDIINYTKHLKCKVVAGLHEVCKHSNPDFLKPSKLLCFLFEKKIPIVVFSTNSEVEIKKYPKCDPNLISQINFGLFETYNIFEDDKSLNLPEKYILYYGLISPYKGLSILVESIKQLGDLPENYKVVIAGSGFDESLSYARLDKNFYIINRYLKNNEISTLIRGASAVVCPYLTMSQSGIPQTVYVFGKPIIASDLNGFKDIIDNGKNGLLFKVGNYSLLSKTINMYLTDKNMQIRLKTGASNFNSSHKEYDWNYIASKYRVLFQNILS